MKKFSFLVIALYLFFSGFSQNFNYDQLPLIEKISVKQQLKSPLNFRGPGPGNQILVEPEQDCNSAIPVCQTTYTQTVSYSGQGNNEEIPSNSSCLGSNEKNSVWYVFTVSASGNLAFDITPTNLSEDYDFALYEITNGGCAGIDNGATTPIRCNFSATGGVTGLSASGTNASEDASGPNQSTVLPVTVGQTYVLVLSNYSSSQNGYTLNFAPSTASIFDVTPPTVLSTFAACGVTTITVKFSEQVLCSSISANGSEFTVTGTGGPYTVTAASGLNCGNATNEVQLTLNTALSGGGPWTVSVGMGTDGNTLIDNCNNPLAPPQTNVFNTSPAAASISGDNSICKGQTMALTASAGTSYLWAGPGTAGQTTNQTISVVQNAAGTFNYTVTVGNGTCGTSTANIAVTVSDAPVANYTVPSLTVCAGSPVVFTNTSTYPCSTGGLGLNACNCGTFFCNTTPNNGTFVTYLWTFGDGGVAFYLGGSPASAHSPSYTYTTPGVYTANLNASGLINTCENNFSQTITVLPAAGPITAIANPTTICPGASSVLTASGGTTYTWTGPSGFNSTSNPVTVTPASTATYTVSTPGCAGSNTTTVVVTVSTGTLSVGPIVGNNAVCPNATAVTYSVSSTGSTYVWTVPAGATITGGQGTNTITVNFGAAGGNIGVTETLGCNTGSATLAVTTTSATLTPSITGPLSVCPNATAVTYSVGSTGSTYVWTVPAGATITGGQGTNTITVDFGATGGNIGLTESTACGSGTATLAISVNSTPVTSAITGSASVCPNATAITYSVTNTVGSTYAWTVPAGATIASGQTTNSITVNFGATGGNISVTETSPCGVGTPVTIAVTTSSTPTTPAITGSNAVCAGSTTLYSVTNTVGNTYTWTVPAGAVITSAPTNANSVTIDWTGSTGGTISVVENSTCGAGTTSTFTVAIINAPAVPTLVGDFIICENASAETYSVTLNGVNTYTWTVTGDATITAGQSTNQITVNFGVTAGTITIREDNVCGFAQFQQSYLLTPPPTTPIVTGPATVCSGANATYTVTNNAGSTYLWTVPAGATITSGQGTNTVTVNFSATGGDVGLTETTSCGTANDLQTVVIITTPTTPAITGNNAVCAGSTTLYSVTNTVGNTYTWTVPAGAVITSAPTNANSVTIDWTGSTGGTISVVENSTCGAGTTSTFTVAIINAPAVPTLVGDFIICENASGEIYSVLNSGNTYTWTATGDAIITAGQSTNQITVNFGVTAGTITIREDNACGFAQFQLPYLLTPPPAAPVVSGSSPVCAGRNYTYSVINNPPSTYNWTAPTGAVITGGQGTNSITVSFGSSGGNVSVTETAACGVATSLPLVVTITPPPSTPIISGVLNVCENATNVSYAVTSNAGSTYLWTTTGGITTASGANTNLITVNFNTAGGTINVTETNSCGNAPASIAVTTTNVTIIAAPASICPGFSTNLTASGATTYTWSPATGLNTTSGATVIANPTVTTVYTISGSDGTCSGDTTVTVTLLPPLTINLTSSTTNLCSGNTSTINVSGADNYVWSPAATLSSSSGASVIAYPTVTTVYTVAGATATCAGTNTISIIVTLTPTITINPTDVTICEGETTIINVNGADSYIWPNANSTINFQDAPINSIAVASPISTQLYFVTGLKNGCPSNLDTLTVTVLPKINPNAGPNDTICFGQTTNLFATGGQTYSWQPNFNLSTPTSAFTTATPFTTTDYTLTASYNGACPQTDSVRVVVNPLPLVYAGNDTTIDVEDVVILNGYSSALGYSWLNTSTLNCTNCLSPVASPLETTTYILTATNQFGCSSADTVTIEVSQEYALYVPSALSPNEDLVNEGWKPQGFGIKKIQIYVFDRWGTKIFEAKDLDTTWNGTYKNDIVQQDVYVYKIIAETYSGNKFSKVGHVTVVK